MLSLSVKILTILAVSAFVVQQCVARCNVCNEYGIACINETSFNLCFSEERDASLVLNCPDNTICVNSGLRCAERNGPFKADCPDSSVCGKCDGLNMFTCTSTTTFVQCNGNERIPGTEGKCPEGLTCDSLQKEICVSDCSAPSKPQCTNAAPTL